MPVGKNSGHCLDIQRKIGVWALPVVSIILDWTVQQWCSVSKAGIGINGLPFWNGWAIICNNASPRLLMSQWKTHTN